MKDQHLGIYGIIEQRENILLIRKSRGPYKGLFDLPGGSPQHGEPLLDALHREIKEETGIDTISYSHFGNFSFLIPYQGRQLYHIALIYRVNDPNLQGYNPDIIDEDVQGSLWINRRDLHKESSSLLVYKVLEHHRKKEG